jgi:hypothetical protein
MGRKQSGDEWLPITDTAYLVGINRNTIRRWLNAGKLESRPGPPKGNVMTKLVSVAAVRALVGDGIHAGRPRSRPPE